MGKRKSKLSPEEADAKRADEIVAERAAKVPEYKMESKRDDYDKRLVIKEIVGDHTTVLAEIACVEKPLDSKKPVKDGKYPYWYISSYSGVEMKFPDTSRFPSKELAFHFVVMVRKAYLAEIKRRPLTESARRYIEQRARSLRDRTACAVSELYDLKFEKWSLLILARECGVTEATHFIDDSDLGTAVQELLELEYGEHPFFSEGCLYDLVGKDTARTILARLEKVIALIKPDKAIEI